MQPVRGVILLPKIPQMHRLAPRSKSMPSSIKNNMNTCCWWLEEKGKPSANPCTYPPIPAMFFGFHILQNGPSENFCNHWPSVCLSGWLSVSVSRSLKTLKGITISRPWHLTGMTGNWQKLKRDIQTIEEGSKHCTRDYSFSNTGMFLLSVLPDQRLYLFRSCKPCQRGKKKKKNSPGKFRKGLIRRRPFDDL